MKGAVILTAAGIIVKLLSAVYRIPFQNIVGDIGFYIYQQVYPFYGIFLVLATTGFPVVISKLYIEQRTRNGEEGGRQLLKVAGLLLSMIAIICCLTMYFSADALAYYMNDPQLADSLRIVAISFLILPLVSVLRGFFQGKGNMMPTAVSQVSEQLLRVLFILLYAYILTKMGASIYSVSGGVYYGVILASLAAFAILLFYFIKEMKSAPRIRQKHMGVSSYFQLSKEIIVQSFAICVSSLLLIFIQLADALNLYALLTTSGFSEIEAKTLKGVYDRGQPLIQLGSIVATSMSLSLVPILTYVKIQQPQLLNEKIQLVIRVSLLFGVGASVGLWAIVSQTNVMLFENDKGSAVLGLMSIVILLSSLVITLAAVHQGLGNSFFPAWTILIGVGIKYFLNTSFVPHYGIYGAVYATYIALALMVIALLFRLKWNQSVKLVSVRELLTILNSAILMTIFLNLYLSVTALSFMSGRVLATFQSLTGAALGAILYLFLTIRSNIFTEAELRQLPFGEKLLHFMKRR
ncbi:oligosaccharide flippase family protein [Cytobacillus kochii]|uniref:putative polysaccharide biosynthesis protein n=1 Tax=Cytobacillus kochii TaxID=859143 RepID=UPI0027847794|nr:polysaccharide biosynthesis protein [Cytobacillus kochii]MDQ0187973.1 PST family polysaccharide transporter [Cytobacillus kochii]